MINGGNAAAPILILMIIPQVQDKERNKQESTSMVNGKWMEWMNGWYSYWAASNDNHKMYDVFGHIFGSIEWRRDVHSEMK